MVMDGLGSAGRPRTPFRTSREVVFSRRCIVAALRCVDLLRVCPLCWPYFSCVDQVVVISTSIWLLSGFQPAEGVTLGEWKGRVFLVGRHLAAASASQESTVIVYPRLRSHVSLFSFAFTGRILVNCP